MLDKLFRKTAIVAPDVFSSRLYDETTFYSPFLKDLSNCQSEAIIESPFITNRRLSELLPTIKRLKERSVRIVIVTKDPREHDKDYQREDAAKCLATLQKLGVSSSPFLQHPVSFRRSRDERSGVSRWAHL